MFTGLLAANDYYSLPKLILLQNFQITRTRNDVWSAVCNGDGRMGDASSVEVLEEVGSDLWRISAR